MCYNKKKVDRKSGVEIVVTRESVLKVLHSVAEPTLKQSISDLGLVRDVMVRDTSVSLTVVLHPDSMSLTAELELEVLRALAEFECTKPHLRFRPMTDKERTDTL